MSEPRETLVRPESNAAHSSVVVSATTFLATALGGGFAIAVVLIIGAGADTDGFFAAYSAYTAFIVFGTTMRVALVPQLGDPADHERYVAAARDLIGRILPIAALVCVVLAIAAPLLGAVMAADASDRTREVATISVALLSIAAFFQVWAAATASVLVGARRFAATSFISLMSLFVSVAVGTGLMLAFGITGASIGMAIGAASFAIGQSIYLRQFGFSAPGHPRTMLDGESWRVVGRMASAAGLPMVMQLYLTIALAMVASDPGAATAYSYAYLTLTVLAGTTVGTVGMVTMPLAVEAVAKHGREAAIPFLRDTGAAGFFVYWPLAIVYSMFAFPLIELVFGSSFDDATLDLFWDASRLFALLGVAWALSFPFTTFALANKMYVRVAVAAVIQLPVHVIAVKLVAGDVFDVAIAHLVTGTFLVFSMAFVVMGASAITAILAMLRKLSPALAIGLVLIGAAVAIGEPTSVPGSLLAILVTGVAYGVIAYFATPNLGRPMIDQLLGRTSDR